VIKPGGGQNDVWHQLSFKGKYAGDVRIELTYYDIRERPQEKKPAKERSSQPTESVCGSEISLPASRSLGPREIKRRPLPQSPVAPVPIEQAAPQRPSKVPQPGSRQHQHYTIGSPPSSRPRGASESPASPQRSQELYYDEPGQYEQIPPDHSQDNHHQRHHRAQSVPVMLQQQQQQQQPWQYPLGWQHRDYRPEDAHNTDTTLETRRERYAEHTLTRPDSTSAYPDEGEIWQQHQRPQSVHMHSDPVMSQHPSTVHRPMPTSANSDSQLVQHHQQRRLDMTSNGVAPYADSPLRHAMSQQEVHGQPAQAEVPPPLPPKHRDTTPRRPRSDFPPNAYIPQPLRIGQQRSSIHSRSPLQSMEDVCDMQQQDIAPSPHVTHSQPHSQRNSMNAPISQQYQPPQQQQLDLYGRTSTRDTQPYISDRELPRQRPVHRSRQNSYELRQSEYAQQVMREPHALAGQHHYHSNHDDTLQPTVEDAPHSPGLQPAVARKAVGASPKKLNTVPFGPDSYDVLNPGSSPVTNAGTRLETQEQAKELERLREVEKLRDLGPIIGNDGREIDPSDHLPVDTWAPEPERKTRKPEHVIHIRSKNDPKRPQGARASPIVVNRHQSNSDFAISSPAPATSQSASSPAARTTPNSFIGGRNRLQKAMPAAVRPLPNQPYGSPASAAVSSPSLASSPQQMYHDEQPQSAMSSQNRRPSYDDRVPNHSGRPPLSEYQVPIGNGYTPRSSPRESYGNQPRKREYTPTKQLPQTNNVYSSSPSMHYDYRQSSGRQNSYEYRERSNSYDRRSDYSYENHVSYEPTPQPLQQQQHYDDPLAAEMSLIDIGPSRQSYNQGSTGRSMARRW